MHDSVVIAIDVYEYDCAIAQGIDQLSVGHFGTVGHA